MLGQCLIIGGKRGADRSLEICGAAILEIDLLEDGQRFLGPAYREIAAGYGFAHGEIVGEGLCGGVQNIGSAGVVAVVEGGSGAAHAPGSPQALDGLALGIGQVLTSSETHQRGIEGAIVLRVVEQVGVLDFYVSRRLFAQGLIVALHAIEEGGGIDRVSGGGVETGFGLLEQNVGLQLLAHGRRDEFDLFQCLAVAVGLLESADESAPRVDVVRVCLQDLFIECVGLRGVVALQIDRRKLNLEPERGLATGLRLQANGALEQPLRNLKLVGLLVDGAEHGKKAGIGERGFVGVGRHLLDQIDSCCVVFELVLGRYQAHPCRQTGGVVVEDLLVHHRCLVVALGGHQNARVLQACSRLESASVVGER